MAKVILSGYIEVPVEDLSAVRKELPGHIEATLAEKGCVVFEVAEVRGSPGRFTVYEEFSNRVAFEHHQQRVATSTWGKVAARATRHYSISEGGSD